MTPPPSNPQLALRATGLLAQFNARGVLTTADVHIASRLATLLHETSELAILSLALTVRGTRQGSVVTDLATVAEKSPTDEDASELGSVELAWPEPAMWAAACEASLLTNAPDAPLRQRGTLLWLARYDALEQHVADDLRARAANAPDDLDLTQLRAGLDRLFSTPGDADQRLAAAICAIARVSVLTGGPGTGKTTTVARLLALLREQRPEWRIALAAPTGKAAARLGDTVTRSFASLTDADRGRLSGFESATLHRLLGWRAGSDSRFRYNRTNRLPFDLVVVDEASMVSLTMMSRLLDALRPTARLVLVGDADQLASVEAGAVLADIVGGVTPASRTTSLLSNLDVIAPGHGFGSAEVTPAGRIRDGVALLTTNHRFNASSAISALASAIRSGRADDAIDILRQGDTGVEFVEIGDTESPTIDTLNNVRQEIETWAANLRAAALRGDHQAALKALDAHRLLCAHRRGSRGVHRWDALAKQWATTSASGPSSGSIGTYHPGEPLLVTANDYDLGLFNGDTGVVAGGVELGAGHAWFSHGGEPATVPLARLGSVQPAYAMTVHRTQGSQFGRVTVILPTASSPLATREALYTAVTRAVDHVRVVGSIESITTSVTTPAVRATGLQARLAEARAFARPGIAS